MLHVAAVATVCGNTVPAVMGSVWVVVLMSRLKARV